MKNKFSLLILLLINFQNQGFSQSKSVPFYFIVDGDSIKSSEKIKLLCYTDEYESILTNGEVSFKETNFDKIKNITLVIDQDTLIYFTSEEIIPLLKQVALNNFRCFYESPESWTLYIDKYPYQLESTKFLLKNDKLDCYSLRIKGCIEELQTLKK